MIYWDIFVILYNCNLSEIIGRGVLLEDHFSSDHRLHRGIVRLRMGIIDITLYLSSHRHVDTVLFNQDIQHRC